MSDWNSYAKHLTSHDPYDTLTCSKTCSYPICPCNPLYVFSRWTQLSKHLMSTIPIGTPSKHIQRFNISYLSINKRESTTDALYHLASTIIPFTYQYTRPCGHKQSVVSNIMKTCTTCWSSNLQTRFYSSLLRYIFCHSVIIYLSILIPLDQSPNTVDTFCMCICCT
jgi:hypothetical protein